MQTGQLPKPGSSTNDYHVLPATEKQLHYARNIAARRRIALPEDIAQDRAALSSWIDAHKSKIPESRFDAIPSAKQVAFAEVIARRKRREVPRECFRDKTLMSAWITHHK